MKKTFVIKRRFGIYVMPAESIVYMENMRRKVVVQTNDGLYEFYGKLSDVEKALDERFLLCHRSYMINMDKVEAMEHSRVLFDDKSSIYLGRSTYARTAKQVSEFLEKRNEEDE